MAKEIVGEMIDVWLNEHPSRTFAKLEEISRVSDTSLRRIRDGVQTPTIGTILSIGRATLNYEKMMEAIALYFPEDRKFFKEGALYDNPSVLDIRDPVAFLESPDTTRVFLTLHTRKGLDLDVIEKRYGEKGSNLVKALERAGFAKSTDGKNFKPGGEVAAFSTAAHAVRAIQHLALSFETVELGSGYARAVTMTESVSPDAAKKLKAVMENAALELKKIFEDPASVGDTVVATSLLMQPIK